MGGSEDLNAQLRKHIRQTHHFRAYSLMLLLAALIAIWWLYMNHASPTYLFESILTSADTHIADSSVGTAAFKDGAVTFDKIDPTVWQQAQAILTNSNIVTTQVITSTQDGLYVRPADEPAVGDITGSYDDGFTVGTDAVALGGDTTGDYVSSVSAGAGLSSTGLGEGAAVDLTVKAGDGITIDSSGVSVSLAPGGGLAFTDGILTIDTTCSDGQLQKWATADSAWECADDNVGSLSSSFAVSSSDGAANLSPVSMLEFGPDSSSSEEFIVSDQGSGTARIRTGTVVPLTNADAAISGDWTFDGALIANGGLSCADCIALGTETTGNYLASLVAGSGIAVTGVGSEGATPTIALDGSLAMFKTIGVPLGTNPVASSLSDTLLIANGDGIAVTGDGSSNTLTFDIHLASGSGLAFSAGDLTLRPCSDGQILAVASGAWGCSSLVPGANAFGTITGDSGNAVADATSHSLALDGGNGITTTASSTPDAVTFDINLAAGSGLAFSGGGLTLQSCSDGQILKRVSSSWTCVSGDTTSLTSTYAQQLAGADNRAIGSSLTPLLTNGSATPQSLGITITSGYQVAYVATVQVTSTLATGPVNFVLIRDDNHDNDCATGGGDGTQVGGQVTGFIATIAQSFTTTLSFVDTAPPNTTNYYQLCASTSISLGTASATNRSLTLNEIKL